MGTPRSGSSVLQQDRDGKEGEGVVVGGMGMERGEGRGEVVKGRAR